MSDRRKAKRGIAVIALLCMVLVLTVGCNAGKRGQSGGQTTAPESEDTRSFTGVITAKDEANRKITVRELNADMESILYYDATAKVTDRYGETISSDKMEIGQIFEVVYRPGDAGLVAATVPEDVWEYTEVGTFSFQSEDSMMRFAGKKYQYSTRTLITSGGQPVELTDLNDHDLLTVRGVGYKIYSIVRTAGHGYIRLANYNDFIGGIAQVGSQIFVPITENMLITAPEGIYRLTLCKGVSVTTKTITVKQGQEVVADFSDYVPATENVGIFTFVVEPEGADLSINGTAVDYSEPVALNYGEYQLTVSMTGYNTYSGILDVEDPSKEIKINLIEGSVAVDGEETTASPSSTAEPAATEDSQTSSSDSSTTKKVDSDHTITVSAPRGVEVYLDNVYKGLAPCKFAKVIGSQTITLSKTGYVTKSYAVDILDDDKNVTLSFSELAEDDTSDQEE